MKNTLKLSSSALIVALTLGLGGLAHGQTLKDAVETTVRSNPDVMFEANQRLANEEALKGARGGFLPKVDMFAGYGSEWSRNASTNALSNCTALTCSSSNLQYAGNDGIRLNRQEFQTTLTQMLFDGFGVLSEVNRQGARVESAAYKTMGVSDAMGLKAIESYLNVLRTRELTKLTKENLDTHLRIMDQIRIRSGGGIGRKSDLEQVEARVGLARANLTAAEANQRDAEINYMRVVGAKPVALVKPESPASSALPGSDDDAVRVALENHPILKSARADVKAAEYQQQAAKSFMSPRFDAEFGIGNNQNLDGQPGTNDEKFAMIRMRWNLFRGGSDYARINETGYFKVQSQDVMNRTARQVEESTRLSWNTMISSQARLPSLREHAVKSFETRDSYAQQFNLGQRTLLDLLDSENEAFTAQSNYITAQYLESFSRYRLLGDTGQVLSYLGVEPPPQASVENIEKYK
jgi:adhesin transport system outer membrane protein